MLISSIRTVSPPLLLLQSALLSTYPGLLDALVALLQRAEPNVAAQCGRALWNLSYRNEVVKSNPAVQSLLPRLVSHLSAKHVKLKQFSIGLLWSLCDSQPATCVEVVGTHDGMRIILQGLTNANSAGGSSDSETYFLLISLLNTLLNNDSTLRAKSIAVSCNVSGILLPLLLRTTSTTLMDRICEVLSTVLFMQSKEQHLFASQGGLKALVDAIQKPALSKCLQRLSLAFLAAVYRSRTWIMTGVSAATPPAELATMQAAREKLESEVEPAFAHLAALFREWQEKNPCTTMCLAVGLTLACLAQNKPRFLRLLLQSNTLPALLRFLTPPQHYSVHDQNKVKEIGLGLLLQVAQSSTEVQRFLCTASPPPSAALPAATGATAAPAPGVVVDPAANGVYGAYFQSLIDCIKIEKLRPATARLVACIVEPAACRPAARLLMSGHAGFVAQLLQGLKQSFPNPLKPAHADRDLTPHAQLCGCLFVLAGGVPPANANQQQPSQQPAVDPDEVNRNFTYLTQLILTDKQVADVLSRLSTFVRHAQQAQQQQALAQQQQQQQQQQQINSVNSAMHSLKPSPPPIPPPAMQQQPPVQQQQPVSHSQGQHSYPQQGSSQQQQQYSQYSSRGGSGSAQPIYHSQQPSAGPVAHVSSSGYNSAVQSGSAHGSMQQQSARPYAQQQQQQQMPLQQKQMQPVYSQQPQQSVQSSPPAYHPSTQQSLPPQGYANPVPNPKASPTAQELLQMAYARR